MTERSCVIVVFMMLAGCLLKYVAKKERNGSGTKIMVGESGVRTHVMDHHSRTYKTRYNEATTTRRTAAVVAAAAAAGKATLTCFLTVGDSGDVKMDAVVSMMKNYDNKDGGC
jgi:hypothetical protein